MSLTEALLFHIKQVEPCYDVDLVMLEFLEVDDLGQETLVPIMFDLVCQPHKEHAIPFEHSKSQLGVGRVMLLFSPSYREV